MNHITSRHRNNEWNRYELNLYHFPPNANYSFRCHNQGKPDQIWKVKYAVLSTLSHSTASCLNIITQNVNGLNDKQKRLSIIQNLNQKNSDIQILIDTRLKSRDETTIKRETENKE